MAEFEDWERIAARRPLSDDHDAAYRQLSEAEHELDDMRKRRSLSPAKLDELAEARRCARSRRSPMSLSSLTKVVEALGGHVEVHAVFDDQTITLLREPAPPAGD